MLLSSIAVARVVTVTLSVLVVAGYTVVAQSGNPSENTAATSPQLMQLEDEGDEPTDLVTDGRLVWQHLTSKNGDIPDPGTEQQTSALILDVDNSGVNDIVIGSRHMAPSVSWFRREGDGWARYVIDDAVLPLEAGGAFYDITGNGALDIVIGEDAGGNKVYWWENPYPNYDPDVPWTRRVIKDSGGNKHHDQIFGDFTGNGKTDLVFWNQGASALFLAEVPDDPVNTEPWPMTEIFSYTGGEMEGLAAGDINLDGTLNIVGGGRWFEHVGATNFEAHVIDDELRFGTAAVGQLVEGGRPEVVFSAADLVGPLRWYQWVDGEWIAHDLLDHDIDHGHSLDIVDIDGDGNLDIFVAEMRLDGGNEDARTWIFYGDGTGNFTKTEIAIGIGNHESKVGDLTGDGRLDILGKPYNWDTPRLDVWLNLGSVDEFELPLNQWARHVIDEGKPWRSLFITSADINGSGHEDIITGGWWYENPGDPGASWVRHAISAPLNNMAAVYDFDGDGHVDILGTQGQGSEANAEFVWARNDGNGNFTIFDNIESAQGTFLQGVAVDRFQNNRLGVALSWHDTEVGVQMLNVPDDPMNETWTWEQISEVSQGEDLSVGDIDGNGNLDLLLGTMWLRNEGDSWSAHTLHETDGEPDRNFLLDMNGNGRLDAIVGYEAISQVTKLAWYEQGEVPTEPWTEHVIANIVGPMSLDVRDMNNNGNMDVVVGEHNTADPSSARLFIYENADGQGGEWIEHVVHTGDEHHMGAQVADIFGDGDLDIISMGWEHDQVLLYENRALSTALNRHLRPIEPTVPLPDEGRVVVGLQALYAFEERGGETVHDVSGVGDPLNLQIADLDAVEWGDGELAVHAPTQIASSGPATKLIDAVQETNALTLEAWITPASASQSGPARIVTMSDGLFDRNLTLGHGHPQGHPGTMYEMRLRTTATNSSGQPSISSSLGTASTELSHLVYTRNEAGTARLYLDGEQIASGTISGDLSNWDPSYRLGLGNEFDADRFWEGTFHLVAFFDRALSAPEVVHNFEEGPQGETADPDPVPQVTWVAPAEDATVSDTVALRVEAPEETARVEFLYEEGDTLTAIGSAEGSDPDGTWSIDWDTIAVPDGSYQLVARAFDAPSNGELLAEATRKVTVRNDEAGRITSGLIALYDFGEGSGGTVHDVSSVGTPLDLQIEDTSSVDWGDGTLTLASPNRIASSGPASKLNESIQNSNELTLEAWISPDSASQSGPARIATVSDGLLDRNLTLGQGDPMGGAASSYEVRLRATGTSNNGTPSIASPSNSASANLQHLMYTRDSDGTARLYIDGVEVATGTVSGNLSNWNSGYRLALGNEIGDDRPWLGTYHLAAFYDRALTVDEVQINFHAGPDADPGSGEPTPQVSWLEPSAGALVSNTVELRVDAPTGTERVEFAYEDGDSLTSIGSVESVNPDGSWSLEWDTTSVPDGSYQLVARAFDAPSNGELLAEASRMVSVRNEEVERVTVGLIALYDFNEGEGDTVHDVSGVGEPIDLLIEDPEAVTWSNGTLSLTDSNRIASSGPATKIISAATTGNAITVEAWITPDSATQAGPARVITVSNGLFDRNLTLGHGDPTGSEGASYEVRLRSTGTNANGQPSLTSPQGSTRAELQHVIYTRDTDGTTRIYLDGELVSAGVTSGLLSNWDAGYRLALGNEIGSDRPWFGNYHLVALYDRALSDGEVQVNYEAGPDADPGIGEPAPRVTWLDPEDGAVVSDSVTLRVNAPQDSQRVEFAYEDEDTLVQIGTVVTANEDNTWSIEWDSTAVTDGLYHLVARAFDSVNNGELLAEATRMVIVRNDEEGRITVGLLALYDFAEGDGSIVHDVSGVGEAIDLQIEDELAATWSDGTLTLTDTNRISSDEPATKLIEAAGDSNALTLEAWITPATASQSGPARVVTISDGLFDRNLTLGHGHPMGGADASYEVRLRTVETTNNGTPSLTSPANSATTQLQHLVYTRDAEGVTRIYLDGELVASGAVPGSMSNWNANYRLALGNEIGADRPWLGTFHLVAFYDRALTAGEVQINYESGPNEESAESD
jgi:hypothetical protein